MTLEHATATRRAETPAPASNSALLDAGLAIARRSTGLTCIAFPVPVCSAAAVVAAGEQLGGARVAWSSRTLTIVGIGIARELRGRGETRWRDVIAGARSIANDGVRIVGDDGALCRPRLLGGLAFASGAADRAPWDTFGDAWFALPRWTYASDGVAARLVLTVDRHDAERWHDELATLERALTSRFAARALPAIDAIDHGDRAAFCAEVEAITAAIARGECAKIVAARSAVVELAGEARLCDVLAALDARDSFPGGSSAEGRCGSIDARDSFPGVSSAEGRCGSIDARDSFPGGSSAERRCGSIDARDSFPGVSSAEGRCGSIDARATGEGVRLLVQPTARGHALIAATPERLVARSGDAVQCDALAGTIARTAVDAEATLLASDKDRREHALVVEAIARALAGADVDAPGEPRVRALRDVLHLHTPITARLREPRHLLELAAALHPTPAVGGTPTAIAVEWIAAHEPARGWYASPVGWFDLDGDGELAVAIRCGVFAGNRAQLWAGGGIVAGSDPARELAETEVKLRALIGAFGPAS